MEMGALIQKKNQLHKVVTNKGFVFILENYSSRIFLNGGENL